MLNKHIISLQPLQQKKSRSDDCFFGRVYMMQMIQVVHLAPSLPLTSLPAAVRHSWRQTMAGNQAYHGNTPVFLSLP